MNTSDNGRFLVVMSTLAVQGALAKIIIPEFQVSTGIDVKVVFDPTKVLMKRLREGERADLIIAISDDLEALVNAGDISSDLARPLVRTGVGIAVKRGAPCPSIATPDELKTVLLDARSVAYSRTGASGIYFAALLDRLGIAEPVNRHATIVEKGLTGECIERGEADIAVQQLSELAVVPGVRIVGPLPAEIQNHTDFSVGLFQASVDDPRARRLIEFLYSDFARQAYRDFGLECLPTSPSTTRIATTTSPQPTRQPSAFVTPVTIFQDIAYMSGQLPRVNGDISCLGRAGENVSLEQAQEAAALCAQACLTALNKAIGDEWRVAQVLKLTGFVASSTAFTQQGQVVDAASRVLLDALGEKGKHARSAVGVQQLPHGATVEIELVVGLARQAST